MSHDLTPDAPVVRLELRHGNGRPVVYDVSGSEFLIGSVAGCDLRLTGSNLPPVICVITRHADGPRVRKLTSALPLQLNGQSVQSASLSHGDLIQLGPLAISVQVETASPAAAVQFQPVMSATESSAGSAVEKSLVGGSSQEQDELNRLRNELSDLRKELYSRYQERRDRLAGLQQSVQNAARKVQEEKRAFEAEKLRSGPRVAELEERERQLLARVNEYERSADNLRLREDSLRDRENLLASREADCARREQSFEQTEARYQADLARLDRLQGTLEQRERQLEARNSDLDQKHSKLQRDALELEEQARQLDAAQVRHREADEAIKARESEIVAITSQLKERASLIEGQQTMLASLRTRLERMRDEVREEAAALAEHRSRHEQTERDLVERLKTAEELKAAMALQSQSHIADREQFEQRNLALQEALSHTRDLQERLTIAEAALKLRTEELDSRTTQLDRQTSELQARSTQVAELQQQIEADRAAIRDREATLAQSEISRKALQEQLLRRSEELSLRQKQLDEIESRIGNSHESVLTLQRDAESKLAGQRAELDARSADLQHREASLIERESTYHRQIQKLKELGQVSAAERKAYHEARARDRAGDKLSAAEVEALRLELETLRRETAREASELQKQLPNLELRGTAVLERLAQAREQLRGHIAELHEYARQSHDDLMVLRTQVQAESERLRQQDLALQRARTEHRHAVTAFRQQLIDWQGRVGEMRQVITADSSRLERQHADIAAAAKQVDESSKQLAQQAANLQVQERQVIERQGEVERHLSDMREWYRRKMRELADNGSGGRAGGAIDPDRAVLPMAPLASATASSATKDIATDTGVEVISITDDLEPGDRKLGDLLRSLQLIDSETLTSLWIEARRQRRSLRQVLLAGRAGGSPLLTLYQLALIEAGNLDALVLDRFRVVDRLRVTSHETVYRVFDPIRAEQGGIALLRHLSEVEAQDAVHPDEFRQRFATLACLRHPNIASTLETLEIQGRPAVVQEWLSGLSSAEWPTATASPGIWYRLVMQTAAGLQAAHHAGLVHGALDVQSVVLTSDGEVKISGIGEPTWLNGAPRDASDVNDLAALGELAQRWSMISAKRKGGKAPKPLPVSVQGVISRLRPESEVRITSIQEFIDEMEKCRTDVPSADDLWEKLLKHTSENATDGALWRKSA